MNVRANVTALLPPFLRRAAEKLDASPIGGRLARGAFWSLSGIFIARGFGLASTIVVARVLGTEDYGELAMVLSTATLFHVFAGFGLGLTATKHVAEFRKKDPDRAGRIMALSAVVAAVTGIISMVVMYLMASWLAANTLAAPHLARPLQIASAMLLMGAMNGAQLGALSGFEAFRAIARISLLAGVLAFPMMVAGVLWLGLEGAVWGSTGAIAVNCVLNHVALRKQAARDGVPMRLTGCWKERGVLWGYSLPALCAGILVPSINWACSALLANQPNGYTENGLYGAANAWFAAIVMLQEVVGRPLMPMLSEYIGNENWRQSGRILRVSIAMSAMATAPAVLLGCAVSPLIMRLYGPGFAAGWPTLVVVLLTAGLIAVQGPVGEIIAASGRMWTGFLMNAGWGLVFLAATWMWVEWGALGVASARLAAYIVHALWTFGYAHVLIKSARGSVDHASI